VDVQDFPIEDLEAQSCLILDEDEGSEPLAPKIRRRGFADDLGWLPA
jgi:hypothetical protein